MTRKTTRWLAALGSTVAATALLAGCVSTSGEAQQTKAGPDASGPLILQSRFTDAEKGGLDQLVKDFNAKGEGQVKVNTIPTNTFNQQLPSYLTAKNPPDVYTWYAGQATRDFADQNQLLDLSGVWKDHGNDFPDALKTLSQDSSGKKVFVPTGYYWWGVYYFKSDFEKLGITPPKTWDEFLAASEKIKSQGVTPFTAGLSDNAWLASAWFDYLDLRINGADFHLKLLSGKEKYDSPEVKKVFAAFKQVLPYFDPAVLGTTQNQAMSDFSQGKVAMYLLGAWAQPSVPADKLSDLAFFQFPMIDPKVPVAEEGPTDGFIASSKTNKPNLTKKFLEYVASAEAQSDLAKSQQGTYLPANTKATLQLDTLSKQGKDMLESAKQITQFYNRDAGDAQQTPADTALTSFIAHPENIDQILKDWDAAAKKIRATS
ncbi:extracellular solute-binding protein [Leifsonia shinshuensis]|uniref:ABC transporter substrate-binding protein n=1 Tax=Leifsonia shinshuensis TaxID=150026 RepID=UPI002857CF31|nr:extracellular solute-binding protein [Leifsonia shinshuensis]MDR6972914.1 multiple sugar transport system substrate-binding protein [Leifsonia shinshuensis]